MSDLQKLTSPNQVPNSMSDEQEREFWAKHELTEEFFQVTESLRDKDDAEFDRFLPLDIDESTNDHSNESQRIILDKELLIRLQHLAHIKHIRFEKLANQFITERLYEEEKREGVR